MIRPKRQKFTVEMNWRITLFSVLLLPLLVSLGFWQLHRAEQKERLQDDWNQRQALAPAPIAGVLKMGMEAQLHRPANFQGTFETQRYWLLENKIWQGRLGYHVLMPVQMSNGDWLVVNRGWVKAPAYRDRLPVFDTPEKRLHIVGSLNRPSDSKFIQESDQQPIAWPHLILEVDLELMSKHFGRTLLPSILLISPESEGALVADWQPINMPPTKHTAYALQWFAMAAALLVMFVFANSNLASVLKSLTGQEI